MVLGKKNKRIKELESENSILKAINEQDTILIAELRKIINKLSAKNLKITLQNKKLKEQLNANKN